MMGLSKNRTNKQLDARTIICGTMKQVDPLSLEPLSGLLSTVNQAYVGNWIPAPGNCADLRTLALPNLLNPKASAASL